MSMSADDEFQETETPARPPAAPHLSKRRHLRLELLVNRPTSKSPPPQEILAPNLSPRSGRYWFLGHSKHSFGLSEHEIRHLAASDSTAASAWQAFPVDALVELTAQDIRCQGRELLAFKQQCAVWARSSLFPKFCGLFDGRFFTERCPLSLRDVMDLVWQRSVRVPEVFLQQIARLVIDMADFVSENIPYTQRCTFAVSPRQIGITTRGRLKLIPWPPAPEHPVMCNYDTYGYLSPDTIKGETRNASSHRKQAMWALGIVLLELAQRKPAFPMDRCVFETIIAIVEGEAPRIDPTLSQFYTPSLQEFIDRCTVKDRETRIDLAEARAHPFLRCSASFHAANSDRRLWTAVLCAAYRGLELGSLPFLPAELWDAILHFYMAASDLYSCIPYGTRALSG